MNLTNNHVAILRHLSVGQASSVYGLAQALKVERALVKNTVKQLADVHLLRIAEKDQLKLSETGSGVLQCIAKKQCYNHLLNAGGSAPVASEKPTLCSPATGSEQERPAETLTPEIVNTVLLKLYQAGRSVGLSKTAGDLKLSYLLVKEALDQLVDAGHVKKYTGGNYYIKQSGRLLVEQAKCTEAPAVDDTDEGQPGGALDAAWSASCEATDIETAAAEANTLEKISQLEAKAADLTDVDEDLATLVDAGLVQPEGERYRIAAEFNLHQMAEEFEQEQSSQDHPVIDDINAKERALGYCSLLLSPDSKELKRCIDSLQVDLAVIRLHQERIA